MRLISIFFFISTITAFGQGWADYPVKSLDTVKHIITYSYQYEEDSLPPHFAKQEDMWLLLGEEVSLFLSKNLYHFEKQMREISGRAELQNHLDQQSTIIPKFSFRLFKYPVNEKLVYRGYVPPNHFEYAEPLDMFEWNLTKDTDTILGYPVQKAICDFGGRKWVAWFSPNISYSDGPYKFNGLPGLILQVHDTQNYFQFEAVSVERPSKEIPIESLGRGYIETTKSAFFKAKDNFRKNMAEWANRRGGGQKAQQNARRISKRYNNPIELRGN